MSDERDERIKMRSTDQAPATPVTPTQKRKKRTSEQATAAAETTHFNLENHERKQK